MTIDLGWLRALGSCYDELPVSDCGHGTSLLEAEMDRSGRLVVTYDVLGPLAITP